MLFVYDDGGRAAAGYKGTTGDCACRAVAIAAQRPYQEVYDLINEYAKKERTGKRKRKVSNARTGVYQTTMLKVMSHYGVRTLLARLQTHKQHCTRKKLCARGHQRQLPRQGGGRGYIYRTCRHCTPSARRRYGRGNGQRRRAMNIERNHVYKMDCLDGLRLMARGGTS